MFCALYGISFNLWAAGVDVMRTPNEGIQPQGAVDGSGVVHLIYFKGKPLGGDLYYLRKEPGRDGFTKPLRVNTQPGSAIAIGTIRGGHLAVGKNGRVHVAWMGGEGAGRVKVSDKEAVPMLYTHLNDAGTAFEPERNLITWAAGLDGGGSVAADGEGNVYVAWHASRGGQEAGEAGRAVFVARSDDEGKTFRREEQANPKPTGACGCCGMRAFADTDGTLYLAYRAANEISRDMTLLISRDRGASFKITTLNRWTTKACPMSSSAFAPGRQGALVATESENQVFYSRIDPVALTVSEAVTADGTEKRKHPVVANNIAGEVLLAWTEGTAWGKGGTLAWQVFDSSGKPTSARGRTDGLPVWSLPTAFANRDGGFLIVY
jgi:hypothetical protein